MRVTVDFGLCNGHGDCVVAAPEVFDLSGEADVVELLDAEPGDARRAEVERAAALCPVAAITIEG